jgi:hypothetical protein
MTGRAASAQRVFALRFPIRRLRGQRARPLRAAHSVAFRVTPARLLADPAQRRRHGQRDK